MRLGWGVGLGVLLLAMGAAARAEDADERRLGPFTLGDIVTTLHFENLTVRAPGGSGAEPFLTIPHAEVDIDIVDWLRGETHVRRLTLDGVRLTLERAADGTWNLGDFRRAMLSATEPSAGDTDASPPFAVDEILFTNGSILFRDAMAGETVAEIQLVDVEGAVYQLARPMLPEEQRTRFELRGVCADAPDSRITVEGRGNVLHAEKSFELTATIRGVPVTTFAPYYQGRALALKGGTLDADVKAVCLRNNIDASVEITIDDLQVAQAGSGVSARIYGMTAAQFVQLVQARGGNFSMAFSMQGDLGDAAFAPDAAAARQFGRAASQTLAGAAAALARAGVVLKGWVTGGPEQTPQDDTGTAGNEADASPVDGPAQTPETRPEP